MPTRDAAIPLAAQQRSARVRRTARGLHAQALALGAPPDQARLLPISKSSLHAKCACAHSRRPRCPWRPPPAHACAPPAKHQAPPPPRTTSRDERDPRWVVQNRDDGKNVGGWHWEERNVMAWSRQQLEELLTAIPAAEAAGGLRIRRLTTCTGEVRSAGVVGPELVLIAEWGAGQTAETAALRSPPIALRGRRPSPRARAASGLQSGTSTLQ